STSAISIPLPSSFSSPCFHRDLRSFPTRRSSDLGCGSVPSAPSKLPAVPAIPRPSSHPCPGLRKNQRMTPCRETWTRRPDPWRRDRKSTRLNSSDVKISYADFCLKKNNYVCHHFC